MNDLGYRDIWLSLAVVLPIGAIGLFLLRSDPQAKGMLVFVLLFFGVFLRHRLYAREQRRREEN